MFPKASVKTQEELEICLSLLDRLGEPEIADLTAKGIEGRHYNIVDGEYQHIKLPDGTDDKQYDNEFADLNQIQTYINPEDTLLNVPYATDTARWVAEVMEDNANYTIANPVAPFVSNTYALKGTMLDSIMTEADTKFIKGDITEEDWKAARDEWRVKGGDDVIKEYNEQYQAAQENKAE